MGSQRATTIVTYCLLSLAATVSFTLPDALPSVHAFGGPPNSIRITGTLRDFKKSHLDFDINIPCATCTGHVASNIELLLDAEGRPVYQGGGFKVFSQWYEVDGHPIAPHLYVAGGAGGDVVELVNAPNVSGNPTVDTFDSTQGPYGDANVGPAPTFQTGSTMSGIIVPTLGSYQEKYEKSGGTHTISSSFRCMEFIVKEGAKVRISGNIAVVVDEKCVIANQAEIELLPGRRSTST